MFDPRSLFNATYVRSNMQGLKNSGLNGIQTPDFCDAGAALHQLRYAGCYAKQHLLCKYYLPLLSSISLIPDSHSN